MEHDVSFPDLAQEISPALLRYLERYTGDRAVAEDLLQETLFRIARGLPGFGGRASVKTWAFSIATRVAADHFRQPANRAHVVEFDESHALSGGDPALDQHIVIDEMNACIRQVIDSLPADYRAVLVLHDLQGLTVSDAASAAARCPTRRSASTGPGSGCGRHYSRRASSTGSAATT